MCSLPRVVAIVVALVTAGSVAACRPNAAAHGRQTIRYLSWTSSGSFSNAFVARLHASLPDTDVETEHTSGSLVVLSSLQNGKGDFGFSLADVTYVAYRRGIEPNLHPHTNLRAIAVRWVNGVYAMVPRTSHIRRFEDLKGKRVGIIPRGSAGELLMRIVLEAHGLRYSDMKPEFLEVDRLIDVLRAGHLDAVMLSATPLSNLQTQVAQNGLRVLPLRRDVVTQLQGQYPFIKVVTIDGELANGPDQVTVGVDSVLVCRADLDEPTAYAITKAFYRLLVDTARSQSGIDPDNASAAPIPLHPGAARFYREHEILNGS